MKITVEAAGLTELNTLLQWRETVLREVFSVPDEDDMTTLMEENRQYYTHALECGTLNTCFAYVDGEIAGCGGVCFSLEMPSPDNPNGKCAYLMNVYAVPEYRGNGVGRAVVRWLVDEAEKKGASKIYLETSECAHSLYQSMGFEELNGYMKYNKETNEKETGCSDD